MASFEVNRVAVIGAGKMGTTLIHALLEEKFVTPEQIVATRRMEEPLYQLGEAEGVNVTVDNRRAAADADLILLCVKPQNIASIIGEIASELDETKLLVSIAAGVSTEVLEDSTPDGVPVVRAMPNTPSLIGLGMTAICAGRSAADEHVEVTEKIFAGMGRTVVLDEVYFNAVTGLAASGPAFVYIIIESLAEGGVKVGLPRKIATECAAQACLGSAGMVLQTGNAPALLKDDVTTPAGCTMDGILKLEEGGLRVTLIKAVVEAAKRAGELVE
jgi:pyrroline-5-carboxylate reductase